jgi:tRNA 2-thiocytidine biosynthesis protein TtcA
MGSSRRTIELVCVSGGKDSYGLLDILLTLKGRAPFPFEIIAMNLDQKQLTFPPMSSPVFESRGIPYRIEQDTYSVVKRVIPEGGTLCSLCSAAARRHLSRRHGNRAPPRSRSAIIGTTSLPRSSSTCSSAAS